MIFLIQYNRSEGRIVSLQEFEDSQRIEAEDARINVELELSRKNVDHEIVLLEAASKDALQRTHQRYFADLRQILESGAR